MPNLLRYDQLDSSRQPAARASAASGELWCARNNVKKQAAASKAAIHQAINDYRVKHGLEPWEEKGRHTHGHEVDTCQG